MRDREKEIKTARFLDAPSTSIDRSKTADFAPSKERTVETRSTVLCEGNSTRARDTDDCRRLATVARATMRILRDDRARVRTRARTRNSAPFGLHRPTPPITRPPPTYLPHSHRLRSIVLPPPFPYSALRFTTTFYSIGRPSSPLT